MECGNLLPLLQFFGVRGLLLPHITSAAAALTTFGRTADGPSFPLSFTAVGSSGLETFLVAVRWFPRLFSAKQKGGTRIREEEINVVRA